MLTSSSICSFLGKTQKAGTKGPQTSHGQLVPPKERTACTAEPGFFGKLDWCCFARLRPAPVLMSDKPHINHELFSLYSAVQKLRVTKSGTHRRSVPRAESQPSPCSFQNFKRLPQAKPRGVPHTALDLHPYSQYGSCRPALPVGALTAG